MTFNFECDTCGERLDVTLNGQGFYISPCQRCLREANEEGYSEGYANGQNDAIE
jgi:uncharacterized metal-binding protein YceD (DUF177 family)